MSHWSGRFIHWLKSIEFEYDPSKYYLDQLLRDLEHERKEKLDLLKQIRKIAIENRTIHYLKTAPGVGLVTAFAFKLKLSISFVLKNSTN